MLTKVTEAAGLREAFPDELGGEATADEMEGREVIDVQHQKGDGSGRPDMALVDFEATRKWINQVVDTLAQDTDEYAIAADIRAIADELNKFPELYTAVLDKLSGDRIISKANWSKTLKHFRPDENQPHRRD
jgi:hypothetical protein